MVKAEEKSTAKTQRAELLEAAPEGLAGADGSKLLGNSPRECGAPQSWEVLSSLPAWSWASDLASSLQLSVNLVLGEIMTILYGAATG